MFTIWCRFPCLQRTSFVIYLKNNLRISAKGSTSEFAFIPDRFRKVLKSISPNIYKNRPLFSAFCTRNNLNHKLMLLFFLAVCIAVFEEPQNDLQNEAGGGGMNSVRFSFISSALLKEVAVTFIYVPIIWVSLHSRARGNETCPYEIKLTLARPLAEAFCISSSWISILYRTFNIERRLKAAFKSACVCLYELRCLNSVENGSRGKPAVVPGPWKEFIFFSSFRARSDHPSAAMIPLVESPPSPPAHHAGLFQA